MNMIKKRAAFIFFIVFAFLVGLGVMTYQFVNHSEEWVMSSRNLHVYTKGELVGAGAIYDVNGEELAKTVDGDRVYSDSTTTRKSTLHVIGDKKGYINTGVQKKYAANLTGYTLMFGTYNLDHGNAGNDIKLTIDKDICNTAYEALDGRKGAVCVVNYKTGDIICSVSTPSFDPENIPSDINSNDYYEGAFINRVLSAHFVPGSTFKIVTAICAIENWGDKAFTKTWECNGAYKPKKGVEITCWGKHDKLNLQEAFAESCNPVFAQIAIELGPKKLQETAKRLGMGSPVLINEVIESFDGTFDVSKAPDDKLGWTGVGQGDTRIPPIAMLRVVSAIANGGTTPSFKYINDIVDYKGHSTGVVRTGKPAQLMEPEVAEQIGKLMRYNGKTSYSDVMDKDLKICAKTGTAQIDDDENHNIAWFTGYMQDDNYPYAFVVAVEHGNSGHRTAAPIANKVLREIKSKY